MELTDEITPELLRIQDELRKLKEISIHVGIQGKPGKNAFQKGVHGSEADLLTIAGVHEYGAVIHAQHAKNLTIPIHKSSYARHVKDFPDLFYIQTKKGTKYGVTRKNSGKGKKNASGLNFLFLCVPSVTIPERSYIRKGFDNENEKLTRACEYAIENIVFEGWAAKQAASYIGGKAVSMIQEYMAEASNFKPKGKIQSAAAPSWAENPLIAKKRLFNSISYTLEGAD